MRSSMLVCVVCTLVILDFGSNVLADTVRMKNGDRLTGTIVKMEDKTLTFKTTYAGEIAIKWEDVEAVETDSPVRVVLGDETSARGILTAGENSRLRLKTDQVPEPLQFNITHVAKINPPVEPAVKLTGRINAGLDVKKGNTDTEAQHVDSELVARTEKNRVTLGAEWNREEEADEKTADNALLYMSYDHFLTRKLFFYTNASFEKDDFKDLNLRTTVGVGSGYQFFETAMRNLSLRGGIAYVNEDFDENGQDRGYTAGRWAAAFDQYFFEKFVQFFHTHEGIVSLEDTDDLLIRTRTGLRFPLKKGFNATAQYNWDWDNSPATGKDRADERYLFTLGYSWQ
ncbi:MAG: DUF481 domain-containing protein [Deltaproteobacteria bacterium]|nr:DUF481 domain-containing protein [Deltaproteobacteria bacterium]